MLNQKILLCSFALALLLPTPISAVEPAVRINEVAWMGTEASANDEWLELYNTSGSDIDLTGWRLEAADGSPSIKLASSVVAGGYFLLERTDDTTVPEQTADQIYSGSLGNSGEWLRLYDASNNLVDEINATDGWPGGDNTTKQTMQRTASGWQTSAKPGGTPRAQNDETAVGVEETPTEEPANDAPTTHDTATSTPTVGKGDIIITELFPNPIGPDDNRLNPEFIEIENVSAKTIDLTAWRLKTLQQEYQLPSLVMNPGSIVWFSRSQTNVTLDNLKEKITLYSTANKIIDQRGYGNGAIENFSYQRATDGSWLWGPASPGLENTTTPIILPEPRISGPTTVSVGQLVTFDGSDSFDPQHRPLTFSWSFGDGRLATGQFVRQIYSRPGKFEVALTVTADTAASSTEKLKITVTGGAPPAAATTTPTSTDALLPAEQRFATDTLPFIFIAEFLPNPEGSDPANEFIELYSQEQNPINLGGWQLDDAEGGSRPFTIPAGTIIKPGQYLAFYAPQTKLSLNNDADAVRLLAPNHAIADYTEYQKTEEGKSFVLDEQFNWQQSMTPTPGEINVLDIQPPEATTTATITPAILGTSTQALTEPSQPATNDRRYLFAGIAAATVAGFGAAIKVWRR